MDENCYLMSNSKSRLINPDNFLLYSGIKINLPRGFGKTTLLVQLSERTRYPILVRTKNEKNKIERFVEEGFRIPEPITLEEFKNGYCKYKGLLLVDDIESFNMEEINNYRERIFAYTTTDKEMEKITNILYAPLFS